MDFSECYVSVWAIVLISYDRFLLVTKGIEYDKFQSLRKCILLSVLLWLTNIARYTCAFVGYDLFVPTWVDYGSHCDGAVLYKKAHVIYDLLTSNIIPVVFIAYFSTILYVDIVKRSRGLPRNWAAVAPESATGDSVSDPSTLNSQATSESAEILHLKQGTRNIYKHRRAAITLALIVGVSSICWIPYFTTIFLAVIFKVTMTPLTRIATCYVFYANSAINPLLYVATNPRIRKGIVKILRCK